jgi:tetratricopeptide (TPR) repeat protein
VFFLGAGISKAPPAQLPLAGELVRAIIETLSQNEYLLSQKKSMLKDLERIRLEVLLQLMYEQIGKASLETLEVFKDGEPNTNHIFLARLAKHGKISEVLTTNFDSLIEKACAEEKVTYLVKARESQFSHEKFAGLSVWKFHGTIKENNVDARDSIQATINQIWRGFSNQPKKRMVLRDFLRNRNFVFMGYSGQDEFTINKVLRTTKSDREIFWIKHSPKARGIKVLYQRDIARISAKDSIDSLLLDMGRGLEIIVDTSYFVKNLWNLAGLGPLPKFRTRISRSKELLCEWYERNLLIVHTVQIVAFALRYIGKINKAISYYNGLLRSFKRIQPLLIKHDRDFEPMMKKMRAQILGSLGDVYRSTGEFKKAIRLSREASVTFESMKDIPNLIRAIGNIASCYHEMSRFDSAIQHNLKALRLCESSKSKNEQAQILANLGAAYSSKEEISTAVKYYQKSLRVTNDIYTSIQTLTNLAALMLKERKTSKSIEYSLDSIRLCKEVGDLTSRAFALENLGDAYMIDQKAAEAMQHYKKAESLFELLQKKHELRIVQKKIRSLGQCARV